MEKNRVLIAFDDLTEFFAIQNDIDLMINRGIAVQLVVVPSYSKKMFEDTKRVIHEYGYDTISHKDKLECKVLLEPYSLVEGCNFEFRIKYDYGVSAGSLKPNPVYTPEWNMPFDAIICYSPITSSVLSAFAKCYIVKPSQFDNYTSHQPLKRVNLLVLLTWGDDLAVQKLKEIKVLLGKEYNLIIKIHHATQYRPDHKGVADRLREVADEYFDSTTNINSLFNEADVVLSDNSSAIFTAIYLGIPVAIFSEASSDYHNLNGIKAAHFSLLIEPRRVPYTNNLKEVESMIKAAKDNIKYQNKLRAEIFPEPTDGTLADVVEVHLGMRRNEEPYYIVKDLINDSITECKSALSKTKDQNKQLSSELNLLRERLESLSVVRNSAMLFGRNLKHKVRCLLKSNYHD